MKMSSSPQSALKGNENEQPPPPDPSQPPSCSCGHRASGSTVKKEDSENKAALRHCASRKCGSGRPAAAPDLGAHGRERARREDAGFSADDLAQGGLGTAGSSRLYRLSRSATI